MLQLREQRVEDERDRLERQARLPPLHPRESGHERLALGRERRPATTPAGLVVVGVCRLEGAQGAELGAWLGLGLG